ncbi:MAG: hypothetical protein M0P58_11380 [Bacteroidales bacterium]|nr:hypothetical protein [Bacteroidales bacterium]
MNEIKNYINEIFGEQVSIHATPEEQINKLPYYISSLYTLWKGELLNKHVYFALYKAGELLTPDQYKKQMDNLRDMLAAPVILVLKGIESYNRNRLIQKKVNFILENKQVFLPALMIDLKDYLKPERARKEHLTPAAQYLLLFHCQKQNLNATTYRQVTEAVPYNYLTVSRAVENLTSFGLCTTEGGKEKLLIFNENGRELWRQASPFLINPVKKGIYINDEIPAKLQIRANINALAHYTNINDKRMSYFAIGVRDFQALHKQGKIRMFSEYDGNYFLEQWKYDPAGLADQGFVDRLSLYLAFRDNKDERIGGALERMMEGVLW